MYRIISSLMLVLTLVLIVGCGEGRDTTTQDNLNTLMLTESLDKDTVDDGTKFAIGEDAKVLLNNNDNSIIAITFDENTMSVWCQENSCNKPEVLEASHPYRTITSNLCELAPSVKQSLEAEYCDTNLSKLACDKLVCSLVEY